MKILHYADCESLSWLTPWLAHMKALADLHIENIILCRPGGDIERAAREAGIEVHTFKPLAASLPALSPSYARIVRGVAPDIIHTRLSSAAGIAGWWRGRVAIPAVATFDKPAKGHYYAKLDRFISCAQWLKRYMSERSGLDADKIEVIHNSVDAARYERDGASGTAKRHELGVADDELVFSGMGIYIKRKGFDVLIRAFAKTCREMPDRRLRLMLIGAEAEEAGMRRSYEALASDLGVADKLIMPSGFVRDVRPWLWASDIFVMPSREEGFSIALLEVLSSSLPVIVSDIDPCIEIVTDGQNGLVARVGDPDSFADAMIRMARMSSGALSAMTERSLELIQSDCTLEAGARKTADLYERMLR